MAGIKVRRREGEGAGGRGARAERNQGGRKAWEGGKKDQASLAVAEQRELTSPLPFLSSRASFHQLAPHQGLSARRAMPLSWRAAGRASDELGMPWPAL